MPEPNVIYPKELNKLIGTSDVSAIVDICVETDFADDPYLIPGSWRHPFNDVDGLAKKLHGKCAIIVCQKGKKLSQGVAALLTARGVNARFLAGGMHAWRDAAETMRIPFKALPRHSLWVTHDGPGVDAIACAWLIRRFVDHKAEFIFVAPEVCQDVADKFHAASIDISDTHTFDISAESGFDRMLGVFGLSSNALNRMAQVVRGTVSKHEPQHSVADGLLALSVGVSHQYQDDQMRLSVGLVLFDALYAWARDGYEKGRDWPSERS